MQIFLMVSAYLFIVVMMCRMFNINHMGEKE